MKNQSITEAMLQFIEDSPTAFHAAANVEALLLENGFEKLENLAEGALVPGGSYYTMQNGSAVLAVKIPENPAKGFRIAASHSDSPCFKIKEVPEMKVENTYVKLNVEKYGGMILSPWLDRPLSVAGRVFVAGKDGKPEVKLVNLKKDLLIIPNVAIHFNREINNGFAYNPQTDMAPLMGLDQELSIKKLCAEAADVAEEEILGQRSVCVITGDKGRIMGAEQFPDRPLRVWTICNVLMQRCADFWHRSRKNLSVCMRCLTMKKLEAERSRAQIPRFWRSFWKLFWKISIRDKNRLWKRSFYQNSFLLSADNGHAVHPNHPEKTDPTNRPYLNGGVVLKYNGSQKYTTDGYSAAIVRQICNTWEIPLQTFANRSDIAGGSTLGNISTAHVSIPSADVGLAQLAMHSAFETAGVKDTEALAQLAEHLFV